MHRQSPPDAMHTLKSFKLTWSQVTRHERGIKKSMSRERGFTSIFVLFDKLYFVERNKNETKKKKDEIAFESRNQDNRRLREESCEPHHW